MFGVELVLFVFVLVEIFIFVVSVLVTFLTGSKLISSAFTIVKSTNEVFLFFDLELKI